MYSVTQKEYNTINIIKIGIVSISIFFLFYGIAAAAVASSTNYKLYTGTANGGGGSNSSASYSAENSAGEPLVTTVASGTSYKIYGGALATFNDLPAVTIVSYNDGELIADDTPTLQWTYSDKDNDAQRSYQVQVSNDNFVTTVVNSGLIASDSDRYTTPSLPTIESGVTYRWRVRVTDGFDYSGWVVATNGFRLTTSAMETPVIWAKVSPTGINIPAKLWQNCASPYLYWEYPVTGLDVAGYSYAWGSIPDDDLDTISESYQTPIDLLSDGVRVFNLRAQNTAGTWSETSSFEVWIDRTAPTLGSYSPSAGTMISTDIPTMTVSVSDLHSGVNPNSISMKINKSTVDASYDSNLQSVIYIPSIPLSEGDNVISFEVRDFVGNKTDLLVWSFLVDTVQPTGSIIINNQDALTNSIYVNLELSAKDTTTSADNMSISNDGVFDTEGWEPFNTRKDNWMLPAISGTRKVYVKFRDAAGNESEISSDTIELVIIAPDTIITSGPSLLTKSTDALFTFKSTVDGCVFRWKFDAGEWSEWSDERSVTKEDLSLGNHYFIVQAAKDVNDNGEIDEDEMDPVPEERTWTIGEEGVVKPELPKKKPFRFWKEE